MIELILYPLGLTVFVIVTMYYIGHSSKIFNNLSTKEADGRS